MKQIQIDFIGDWQKEILKYIKKKGIKIPNNINIDSLIIKYFTYLRKKGSGQSYNIYKAKEFKCPNEFIQGLNQIIDILKHGGSITPYLSKQAVNLEEDGMFNDWGVLHLHLGKEMEKNNKYIERTGSLLFVYFKENAAYLINVYKHGDWTKKEVLQTMYNNWPELIEPFILKEVTGLSAKLSEADYQEIRKSGGFTLIEIKDEKGNNIVITSPGMGIASSVDSIIDIQNYDYEKDKISSLEDLIRKNINTIEDIMQQKGMKIPEKIRFYLVLNRGKWYIEEQNTKLIIEFY